MQQRKDTAAELLRAVMLVADDLYQQKPDNLVGRYSSRHWLELLQSSLSDATFNREMDVFRTFTRRWTLVYGVEVADITRDRLLYSEMTKMIMTFAEQRGIDVRRISEDFHAYYTERMRCARGEVVNSMASDDVVQGIALRNPRRAEVFHVVSHKISSQCTARQAEVLALYVAAAACPLRLPRRIKNEASVWDLERNVISAIIKAIVGGRQFNDLKRLHGDIGAKFQRERPDLLFYRAIQAGASKRHALITIADPFREQAPHAVWPSSQSRSVAHKTAHTSGQGVLEYISSIDYTANAHKLTAKLKSGLDIEKVFGVMLQLEEAKHDTSGSPSDNLKGILNERQLATVRRAGLASYVNRYRWMTDVSMTLGLPPSRSQISWVAGVTRASVRELMERVLQKGEIRSIISSNRMDFLFPVAKPGTRRPSATARRRVHSNRLQICGANRSSDDPHDQVRDDAQDPAENRLRKVFENGDYATDD